MKTKISALTITILMIISCFMMQSCEILSLGGSSYMTEDEVKVLIEQGMYGNITVEAGDSYNVSIQTSSDDNVVAGKSLLSAVSVVCKFEQYTTSYLSSKTKTSSGSGVIYQLDKENGDAYIITNYHVVYYSNAKTQNGDGISEDISVYLYGQESSEYAIPAQYIGGSMSYDLAVLKVDGSKVLAKSNAVAVEFADSNEVAVLDKAIAIGNPEALGISATLGYINVDSEYITMESANGQFTIQMRVMRMDTAVNSGNSGGGLFDNEGKLIGIVNAKLTNSENMSYAIPSNFVKYTADNIIHYHEASGTRNVYRCYLGITVGTSEMYTEYDVETGRVHKREKVVVSEVSSGSLAEGILKSGDIINSITVDGVTYEVTRMFVVTDSMLNAREGSRVSINVSRNGESVDLDITIDSNCIKIVE